MPEKRAEAARVLEAVFLCKQYGDKRALDAVSFQLKAGECLGVAGHNGSGKSTLLSLVAQTIPPDCGQLSYGGTPVLGDRNFARAHIGYVPQQESLLEDVTVEEILRAWQALCAVPDDSGLREAQSWLGLLPLFGKRISALSGGMKKRVSIAMALLNQPDILILDEVSSSLDRKYSQALRAYLKDFLQNGGSVLYCTHQKKDLTELCNRVLILQKGVLVFDQESACLLKDETLLDQWMAQEEEERE